MTTQITASWKVALLFSGLVLALACGDSGGGGGDDPPDLGDGSSNDGSGSDGTPDDGSTGDGTPDDGSTGDGTPDDGSTGDGGQDGDDGCLDNPQTNEELLNSCPPAGVERRQFDNAARLPASYTPGQPLPELP